VLRSRGVELPLPRQSTTNADDRFDKGLVDISRTPSTVATPGRALPRGAPSCDADAMRIEIEGPRLRVRQRHVASLVPFSIFVAISCLIVEAMARHPRSFAQFIIPLLLLGYGLVVTGSEPHYRQLAADKATGQLRTVVWSVFRRRVETHPIAEVDSVWVSATHRSPGFNWEEVRVGLRGRPRVVVLRKLTWNLRHQATPQMDAAARQIAAFLGVPVT
jgi:hypothetical protein